MVNELEFLEGIIKSRIKFNTELEVYSKIEVYEEILEEIEEIKASRICGRMRVEKWTTGDRICEKCKWNIDKEKYERFNY